MLLNAGKWRHLEAYHVGPPTDLEAERDADDDHHEDRHLGWRQIMITLAVLSPIESMFDVPPLSVCLPLRTLNGSSAPAVNMLALPSPPP